MEQREVTILKNVVESIAEIALFIESKGIPDSAKKYIDNIFLFFEKLSNRKIKHRNCEYKKWEQFNYCCVNYKRKYVVAFLDLENEIIICDFVPAKLLI